MTSRRLLKAAEAIRSVVGMAILADLKDPRVKNVTVVGVEVMPDMKQAKVMVSIMGDEKQQRLTLHGLQSSAGFLQHKIADRIETRYTPRLEFVLDTGVKNTLAIEGILRRVLPKDKSDTLADASDELVDKGAESDAEPAETDLDVESEDASHDEE